MCENAASFEEEVIVIWEDIKLGEIGLCSMNECTVVDCTSIWQLFFERLINLPYTQTRAMYLFFLGDAACWL